MGTAFISRDPAVIKVYEEDPLVYRGPLPAEGSPISSDNTMLADMVSRIKLPILIMAGNDPFVTDGIRSKALYEAVGSEDITLHLYDALRHEIFPDSAQHIPTFADIKMKTGDLCIRSGVSFSTIMPHPLVQDHSPCDFSDKVISAHPSWRHCYGISSRQIRSGFDGFLWRSGCRHGYGSAGRLSADVKFPFYEKVKPCMKLKTIYFSLL